MDSEIFLVDNVSTQMVLRTNILQDICCTFYYIYYVLILLAIVNVFFNNHELSSSDLNGLTISK